MTNYRRYKRTEVLLTVLASILILCFGVWWFNPANIADNFTGKAQILDLVIFGLLSYVIWHPIVMEMLIWAISSHIKGTRRQKPISGLKVAFITTFVPKNEPIAMLETTLPTMVNVDYPHDTWLLDEGNSPEAKALCEKIGALHFSRKDKTIYHTPNGKFTKTKGGNHNSWYDAYGDNYDIVAQIDPDFIAKPTFLTHTLGYFRDPKVAFVGTPQIYGNINDSIVALGAAEQQHSFYGSVLQGLCGMGMTLLIGANHIIRVAALKQVNHYSAHITEDLLTGMKLHANGWKSVYTPEPLAVGEAPTTWEAYFSQQMRWAYGCIDILFKHSPKLFKKMGLRQTLYYFFLQQHYFSGIAMMLGTLLLCLYFFAGIRAANIDALKFSLIYSIVTLSCWLMSLLLQRYNVYKENENQLFLAGKLISIAAWPIWFLGFISVLIGKRLTYKVTPKGEGANSGPLISAAFIPHIVIGTILVIGLLSSFVTHRQNPVMIFWAISTSTLTLATPFFQPIARYCKKILTKLNTAAQNFLNKSQPTTSHPFKDIFFLITIVLLSAMLYVGKIGFYSDDWSFLSSFNLNRDQSIFGLIEVASTPNTFMRPMQNIYDAILYKFFGLNPMGYQITNTLVFMAIIVLFYLILRLMKMPRIATVSIPLVYSLLPHYATDRFWYAAFQVNLSMMFYFLSLYSGLKAFTLSARKVIMWKILSLSSLIASVLSYEVAIPLILLNILLFGTATEIKRRNKENIGLNHTVFIAINFIVMIYLLIFKLFTTTRLGILNYPKDLIQIITSIFHVNYFTLGINLPNMWAQSIRWYSNPSIIAIALIIYVVVCFYLYSIVNNPKEIFPSSKWMRTLTILSIPTFILGYAIFFGNNKVGFSPTGIDNRVTIAAAIGVACTIIGCVGWLSKFFSQTIAKLVFCTTIAFICSGGFITINALSLFWQNAYTQQQIVLDDIQAHFPYIPRNTTLILDGVCPYDGPAIVFESQWDLRGALQIIYNDTTLKADIVSPRLKVSDTGISTQIYTFPSTYEYENLVIYNYKQKKKFPISDAQAANKYFEQYNRDKNNFCPDSSAGNGVDIL